MGKLIKNIVTINSLIVVLLFAFIGCEDTVLTPFKDRSDILPDETGEADENHDSDDAEENRDICSPLRQCDESDLEFCIDEEGQTGRCFLLATCTNEEETIYHCVTEDRACEIECDTGDCEIDWIFPALIDCINAETKGNRR